jgi:phosphate acetyltransferase
MDVLQRIQERARAAAKTIILPEGDDPRILAAAKIVTEQHLARLIVMGDPERVAAAARAIGFDAGRIAVLDPMRYAEHEQFSQEYFALRKHKGITPEQAAQQMRDAVFCGAMLVKHGRADGFVAGATRPTADIAKAAMYCIGFAERVRTISSSFLISVPQCEFGVRGNFVFADCGIIPDPSPMQLANIAKAAADLFSLLVEETPRVALLSFSSLGSAEHPMVDKVRSALTIIRERYPELQADGELQLDAAIVPDIALKKAAQSPVAGKANVLIFPDLNAGNIGYKLVQRLAKAEVTGPMMAGLAKPCSDLSRGCTVEEVVNAVCTTAIRAG